MHRGRLVLLGRGVAARAATGHQSRGTRRSGACRSEANTCCRCLESQAAGTPVQARAARGQTSNVSTACGPCCVRARGPLPAVASAFGRPRPAAAGRSFRPIGAFSVRARAAQARALVHVPADDTGSARIPSRAHPWQRSQASPPPGRPWHASRSPSSSCRHVPAAAPACTAPADAPVRAAQNVLNALLPVRDVFAAKAPVGHTRPAR